VLQRRIPLVIVFITGVLMSIQYFIPHPVSQSAYNIALTWFRGVSSMAYAIAVISFVRHHSRRLKQPQNSFYSAVALAAFLFMCIVGFGFGIEEGTVFYKMYLNVQVPLQATTFSLLAFYMASAAYRAFRVKGFEATLLLITAFIVMFGVTTIGNYIPFIPKLTEWLMAVPNLASKRGILIGVGLGMISTSLKIILGIERNWLGG